MTDRIRTALFAERFPGGVLTIENMSEHPGAVWFVDSTNTTYGADSAGKGKSPDAPFLTLDYAIGKCTASKGDVIYLMPGHTESIASAATSPTLDIIGVKVIGLGSGQLRPRLSFTHVDASLVVSAANCSVENVLFLVGVDSLKIMADVNADDFTLKNCEFRENTAVAQQWLVAVDINGGGANAADRCKIQNCRFISEAAGANEAIEIGAVQDGIEITDCWITGDYAVAGIHSAAICTNMLIARNSIRNTNAGDFAIELSAAATGMCVDNRFYADGAATTLDPGSLMCAGNLAVNAIDQSAVAIPATASAVMPAGSIGAASFAAGAIDATAIANGAIDAATFAAGAIDAAAIANAAIDAATFAADALQILDYAHPRCVVKADGAVLAAGGGDPIFDITGGPVRCKITGLVTTVIGGAANMSLTEDTTTPAATVNLNAAPVAIDADAAGTIYMNRGATGVFTPSAGLGYAIVDPVTVESTEYILTPGTVKALASAPQTGVIAWYMDYVPLSPLSRVAAAA